MTTLEIIDNKIEKTEELLARAVEVSDYDQRNFYGSIYLTQGSHFLSQAGAKMASCQRIEHGSHSEHRSRQSCISSLKPVQTKRRLMNSWKPVDGATSPAVHIVANSPSIRWQVQMVVATNGFCGVVTVVRNSLPSAQEQSARKAVFLSVTGVLPSGPYHPQRKGSALCKLCA